MNKRSTGSNKVLGNFQTTFSAEIEANLAEYLLRMEEVMFDLTTVDIRCLAYQMLKRIILLINLTKKQNLQVKIGFITLRTDI